MITHNYIRIGLILFGIYSAGAGQLHASDNSEFETSEEKEKYHTKFIHQFMNNNPGCFTTLVTYKVHKGLEQRLKGTAFEIAHNIFPHTQYVTASKSGALTKKLYSIGLYEGFKTVTEEGQLHFTNTIKDKDVIIATMPNIYQKYFASHKVGEDHAWLTMSGKSDTTQTTSNIDFLWVMSLKPAQLFKGFSGGNTDLNYLFSINNKILNKLNIEDPKRGAFCPDQPEVTLTEDEHNTLLKYTFLRSCASSWARIVQQKPTSSNPNSPSSSSFKKSTNPSQPTPNLGYTFLGSTILSAGTGIVGIYYRHTTMGQVMGIASLGFAFYAAKAWNHQSKS